MNVDFYKINLGELLTNPVKSGEKTLRVPQFQRKYVWRKEDEVLRLLDDFFNNVKEGEDYFFGPIIIRYKPSEDSQNVDIVDGQQRIVTFCLLIRAVIDVLESKNNDATLSTTTKSYLPSFKVAFRRLILTGDILNPQPRVKISKLINPDFRKLILLSDKPDKYQDLIRGKKNENTSFRAIRQAYLRTYDYLQNFLTDYRSDKEFLEIIQKILTSLDNRQQFLLVLVQEYADAFTIFESINALGKGLTVPDLVKNLSFRHLYEAHKNNQDWLDEMESEWDNIESQVTNFTNFIYHMWVSMHGTCPKNKVYKNLETQFKEMSISDNEKFVVETIPNEASAYSAYENPKGNSEIDTDILELYSALKSLGATRCYPVLLSLDRAFRENRLSMKNQLDFLRVLTSLTFWYSGICENDAKRLEKEYHSIAKQLNTRSDSDAISGSIRTLKTFFPDEKICHDNFISNKFIDKSLISLILRSTENHLRTNRNSEIKPPIRVHIEHILPINPQPNGPWFSVFNNTQHEEYKFKIGNLTLLDATRNQVASNHDFSIKKEQFAKSALLLNKDIALTNIWDSDAIDRRGLQLYNYSKIIWPFL